MESEKISPRVIFAKKTAQEILAGMGNIKLPIKLDEVVKYLRSTKGIQIEIYPKDLGGRTRGIQVTETDYSGETLIIGYNCRQHVHSKRFTVAHELGHFLLRHTCADQSHCIDVFDIEGGNVLEVEANQFASELLVPVDLFLIDFNSGCKDASLLAQKYWVSEQVIWRKIMELRLLNKM